MNIDFVYSFDKYIKGKKVTEYVSYPPYGDYTKPDNERFYGDGIKVSGGYKMISFGGGCSGEDCNVTFIISPKNKIIAKFDW